jgi:GNAT superfamily N-acetyltransferase
MLPTIILLSDGSKVLVRPITRDDRPLLRDGLARLSAASRYKRFLAARESFSESELDYLTNVDHHDHEALLAFDVATGEGVGLARYVRTGERTAEPAITVADAWQGRGLGSRLAHLLALRAREAGIRSFTAVTLGSNRAAACMLASLGTTRASSSDGHLLLRTDLPTRRQLRRRCHGLTNACRVTRRRRRVRFASTVRRRRRWTACSGSPASPA